MARIIHQADNDWELYSTGKKQSSSSQGSASFLNTGYLINYAEIQSLLQRVGDLRQGNQDDNVWVHIFTGKFDAFSSHSLDSFDMHYHGLQLGADKSYSFEKGLVYMGAFVGFTDSSQNYSDGNGSLNSNSAGVYATYIMNSGGYLDGVLKYQHIKNELDVVDTQGDKVNGDGSSNGFTASIEGGHRFSFNHESDGWYIEPQIQSTYTRQGSSTINNSNGLTVNLDSYESLLSRVGILMGYEINQPDENPINIYLKNSWLHEFDGDASYKLNGSKEEISFSGDAWTSGVGLSVLINKKHTLYVDVERTLGNKFNQSRANIGYRFSF